MVWSEGVYRQRKDCFRHNFHPRGRNTHGYDKRRIPDTDKHSHQTHRTAGKISSHQSDRYSLFGKTSEKCGNDRYSKHKQETGNS